MFISSTTTFANTMEPLSKKIMFLLIKYKANLEIRDFVNGATALHFAAFIGSPETVDILCKIGANVNAKDKNERTPTQWINGVNLSGPIIKQRILAYYGAS